VLFEDYKAMANHVASQHCKTPGILDTACPLCTEHMQGPTEIAVVHLARHMEEISLGVLPRGEEHEEESDVSELTDGEVDTIFEGLASSASPKDVPIEGMARPISGSRDDSETEQQDTVTIDRAVELVRQFSEQTHPQKLSSRSSHLSASSSVPNRDYILDLADPDRVSTNQDLKYPGIFKCNLCPKEFTRLYNLRSHLRRHTDDRPFVCSLCGKAFTHQHDRKRHEELHSGGKKFICRGNLKDGNPWGCGRRFARADAMGRHFRSEAGRVCIRPLVVEELREKDGKGDILKQGNDSTGSSTILLNSSGTTDALRLFPAAVLVQYPALATMDWNLYPTQPGCIDEITGKGKETDGRSSFDAGYAYY
jgi:hypothetical protein